MVDSLLKTNDLPKLEECLKSSEKITTNVGTILEAFVTVDINSIMKGVQECDIILKDLPQELEKCGELGHDQDRIV